MDFFCAMIKRLIFIFMVLLIPESTLNAQSARGLRKIAGNIMFSEDENHNLSLRKIFHPSGSNTKKENVRLTAIALDITLGILGVHRLYLGTDVKIAAAYALTCGGGCILWLVDLGLLIGTEDITPFLDNPHLFMWTVQQ